MSGDVTDVKYWVDIVIKSAIGILVSIIGMDYRSVKNSLKELEQHKYQVTTEMAVAQSNLSGIKHRLDRIESKLDKALER